jgi:predicted nicotinamide N-methyase
MPHVLADRMKELAQRYPLVDLTIPAAGRSWRLTAAQDQDALLEAVQTEEDVANFPYGLMLWPSAIGLAEWLARSPSTVQGKHVLEIGAGVGLAGLAARMLGAEVTQTDFQADALTLCRHNAACNGIDGVRVMRGDWRDFPSDLAPCEMVLGSDVLYERSLHPALESLLPRLIVPGGQIVLSDPLRPQALEFIGRFEARVGWKMTMEGMIVPWEGADKDIALFLLKRQ